MSRLRAFYFSKFDSHNVWYAQIIHLKYIYIYTVKYLNCHQGIGYPAPASDRRFMPDHRFMPDSQDAVSRSLKRCSLTLIGCQLKRCSLTPISCQLTAPIMLLYYNNRGLLAIIVTIHSWWSIIILFPFANGPF